MNTRPADHAGASPQLPAIFDLAGSVAWTAMPLRSAPESPEKHARILYKLNT